MYSQQNRRTVIIYLEEGTVTLLAVGLISPLVVAANVNELTCSTNTGRLTHCVSRCIGEERKSD